jgi:hypothetical protein
MKNANASTLLQMRLLVGYLGERAQYGWWSTGYYERSSLLFLEPVFAKTAKLAQYHGTVEAARRLHDEHLSVGSYHLFRLPEELEQDLHLLAQSGDALDRVSGDMESKEAALAALQRLAPGEAELCEGPTAVGTFKDLDSADVVRSIAGAYLSAFSRQSKTYPYMLG